MTKKSKTVIVTGGAGFIGSHLVDLLLIKKYQVIVIDNLSGGRLDNLKQHKNNKKLIFKKIDINNISKDEKIFKNVSYVFHFAGIGDIVPSIENPSNYMMTNIQGTINILEASRFSKVKKFIYAASSSCYGINNKRTNEGAKIKPQYPYALSKFLGEKAALHWHKVYKLPVNSIRIFNAYGPRVRTTGVYGAVFGVFLKQKLNNKPLTVVGNGKQARDFVYVTDVAKAFLKAATTNNVGEIFNLGSDAPKSVNQLAKLIGGKIIYIPDRPAEPRKTWANINKIKKKLNWKPTVNFNDGVRNMLDQIDQWKTAPLWTPETINVATKTWFKYLK
ncbi:GDP-mannose 4,6-dehydratase [Candidatus Pelagibacter sp.]|nr:GDP-mannose 4,6-dehydratase [Candidatus Pelagibacter sp.]